MGRMSFLVSALLACSLAAVVLAAALLVGLFPSGSGGVAATARPSTSALPQQSVTPTVAPTPTPAPSPTPAATFDPATGGTYTVQPGEFLSLIGEKLGVPWQLIAQANDIQPPDYVIVPGQVLTIPAVGAQPTGGAGAEFHIVQPGDTITGIAQQYGVDPTDLADFNNIADWNSIRVGDQLFIPGPGWTPLPEPTF